MANARTIQEIARMRAQQGQGGQGEVGTAEELEALRQAARRAQQGSTRTDDSGYLRSHRYANRGYPASTETRRMEQQDIGEPVRRGRNAPLVQPAEDADFTSNRSRSTGAPTGGRRSGREPGNVRPAVDDAGYFRSHRYTTRGGNGADTELRRMKQTGAPGESVRRGRNAPQVMSAEEASAGGFTRNRPRAKGGPGLDKRGGAGGASDEQMLDTVSNAMGGVMTVQEEHPLGGMMFDITIPIDYREAAQAMIDNTKEEGYGGDLSLSTQMALARHIMQGLDEGEISMEDLPPEAVPLLQQAQDWMEEEGETTSDNEMQE